MKRLLALFLTGALTLSLFGCAQNAQSVSGTTTTTESSTGSSLASEEVKEETEETASAEVTEAPAEEETKEEAAPEENEDKSEEAETAEEPETAEVTEAPEETETAETTEETDAAEQQAEEYAEAEEKDESFVPGTISETTYTQSHFGFKITLEEPWFYASDEELAAQNQIIIDAANDASITEAVEKGNLYVDMVASNSLNYNTIMVRIVKMGLADFFLDKEALYAAYAEAIHQDAVNTGMTDIEDVSGEVSFLGENVPYVGVKGQLAVTEDFTTEMWYNCILRQEGTFACLIFFSGFTEFGGETFEELAGRFEPA